MAARFARTLAVLVFAAALASCSSTGSVEMIRDPFDNSTALQLAMSPTVENGEVYEQYFKFVRTVHGQSASPTTLMFHYYSYGRLKLSPVKGKISINSSVFEVDIEDMDSYLSAPDYGVERLSESDASSYRQKYVYSNLKGKIVLDPRVEGEILTARSLMIRIFTLGAALPDKDYVTLKLAEDQVEALRKLIRGTR